MSATQTRTLKGTLTWFLPGTRLEIVMNLDNQSVSRKYRGEIVTTRTYDTPASQWRNLVDLMTMLPHVQPKDWQGK